MQIIESVQNMNVWRQMVQNRRIGFVPTMGALHAGHASLLQKARQENEIVVLSIFVNPTQFNDPNDFSKYPKTWESDLKTAEAAGVDIVFAPDAKQMYPDDYRFKLTESQFSTILCGEHRPGHFDGVLSVVLKLFNVVMPSKAYFGEKDHQQLSLIQSMVQAFFVPVEVIPVPTVRENDGLAMSSRNARLSPEQRKKAPRIYEIIRSAKTAQNARAQLEQENFAVDYVTDLNQRRFVAVNLGEVRLIDNVKIEAK